MSGLLNEVVAVRSLQFEGVDTAVVSVRFTAPSATLRVVEHALRGLRHECVLVDRPAHGTVHGLTGTKDGRSWPIGTQAEVLWINEGTRPGLTIASAIPPRFDAYATVAIGEDEAARRSTETRLLQLLGEHLLVQPWWLGYLDTGAHDVGFDRAPKVIVYAVWTYVLVRAGPTQAADWREDSDWRGCLPDLIFPVDHSWLVLMLWDGDWRCVGGPAGLIRAILREDILDTQPVGINENATPQGTSPSERAQRRKLRQCAVSGRTP